MVRLCVDLDYTDSVRERSIKATHSTKWFGHGGDILYRPCIECCCCCCWCFFCEATIILRTESFFFAKQWLFGVDYMAPKWQQMYSISLWFSHPLLFFPGMIFYKFPLTWEVGRAHFFLRNLSSLKNIQFDLSQFEWFDNQENQ